MDPGYERDTIEAEDCHWWYRGRRRIVVDVVRSLHLPRGAAILDAGCGSGRNLVELARFGEVVGLEPSATAVDVARARGIGKVVQSPIHEMPFDSGSFDLIASLDVLEHIEDDLAALTELRRAASPRAKLLVTVPAYPRLWSSHDVLNHHHRRYTLKRLLGVADASGWRPLRTTHFNLMLLPAAALWRVAEPVLRHDEQRSSELTGGPRPVNWLLEQPLRAEAALLRRGRRIPAGLSLLWLFEAGEPGYRFVPGER